ncbi:MAG: hypothetical protein MN733_03540 [Nitrososphaera sp.]|nr:hypothetical protein [Nitrososphaera sp.]
MPFRVGDRIEPSKIFSYPKEYTGVVVADSDDEFVLVKFDDPVATENDYRLDQSQLFSRHYTARTTCEMLT